MEVLLSSLEDTNRLAKALAPLLKVQDVILLQGDLGVGKTCFARALLHALGVTGEVPSPTFTLVQSYDVADLSIFHFDLYRLKVEEEIEELGFDDAVIDGVVLVEWPEKAESYMPRGALKLQFDLNAQGQRKVSLCIPKKWQDRLGDLNVSN